MINATNQINQKELVLRFDLRTIEHLGIQMYKTLPPVLSELISNSYDADATCVNINFIDTEEDKQIIVSDSVDMIKEAVEELLANGAEIIIVTGGMSVDPDDVTPTAIKNTGAELVCYGSPVLPGAMFLLAYKGNIPIVGLPACVMYSKITVFDLVLPRILANEKLTNKEITEYGHGGMCMNCEECIFPKCSFGK